MTILEPVRRVLLTGFEPFGGESFNASEFVVKGLKGTIVSGSPIQCAVLPCAFVEAPRVLRELVEESRPDLVICLGEASGRTRITPEHRAVNLDHAPIADNRGRRPRQREIFSGAPLTRRSRLPVKGIVASLSREGFPAAASWSAGRHVCNHVFYHLMHHLRVGGWNRTCGGFIHVPALRPGLRSGKLALEDLPKAIRLAITTALDSNPGMPGIRY
jgi:pyroglutamyl-peptidase